MADLTDVRRDNLAAVLRALRAGGPTTRARIAEETGLTKAAVSSLMAELVARGLAREGGPEQSGYLGRPGRMFQVDGYAYGIGVEINVDYVSAVAVDLTGATVFERRLPLDVRESTPTEVVDAVAGLARKAARQRGRLLAGITVAVPGVVDHAEGRVVFASNLDWHEIAVGPKLARRLRRLGTEIVVDNDVKLAATAEWAVGVAAGTANLAYVSGEAGVGAGFLSEGRLVRGTRGFSGEIGHLPLDPERRECACGRRGCWEAMVGLGALLRHVADPDDDVHDPRRDIDARLAEVRARAAGGDRRTLSALDTIGDGLGLGASVLINMVNPEVLVLGGYFAALGDLLLDRVVAEVAARVVAPDAGGCRIALSDLGFTAAGRGGAHAALERVVADPTRCPVRDGQVTVATVS